MYSFPINRQSRFMKSFPDMQGPITDLLIGDLFNERVDSVWKPMESLYAPDQPPIPSWDDDATSSTPSLHATELELPAGKKP